MDKTTMLNFRIRKVTVEKELPMNLKTKTETETSVLAQLVLNSPTSFRF